MNKDDKNRHFVLLIIDISKDGAKEMGRTHFREWCYSMMTRFCSKKIYEQANFLMNSLV